ncbi:MAG: WG repeat-containing protein [Bacteroidaceae bacterium]|nr:WG repeat-containing protein [Bacteroidaceae bacterium]
MKTMKRSVKFFWQGLTGILAYIANWFTVVLGMKDESKYGKFLRRTVGTCFAILMVLLTGMSLWAIVVNTVGDTLEKWFRSDETLHYGNRYLSPTLCYHQSDYEETGFLFHPNGKKGLKNICWIACPEGEDSLVCYSDGKKRGYFSKYTGKVILPPSYNHAWVFSEGLAAVEVDGFIKFIDPTGKVVIETSVPYIPDLQDYVFHNDYCVVHDKTGKYRGLIDKHGRNVLPAVFSNICSDASYWIAKHDSCEMLLDAQLDTVLHLTDAYEMWFSDNDVIEVIMNDHTLRTYTLQGELIEDNYIQEMTWLTYETSKFYYDVMDKDDDGEYVTDGSMDEEPTFARSVANCMMYEAAGGWYGLITPSGRIITPPDYCQITAVGKDLYLCYTIDPYHGILLNGKGQKVE